MLNMNGLARRQGHGKSNATGLDRNAASRAACHERNMQRGLPRPRGWQSARMLIEKLIDQHVVGGALRPGNTLAAVKNQS